MNNRYQLSYDFRINIISYSWYLSYLLYIIYIPTKILLGPLLTIYGEVSE